MHDRANAVVPKHTNVRALLETLPARHVDAVILLDSQDWMAPQEIKSIWDAIDRCGKDDVRVIFRTAGESVAAGRSGSLLAAAKLVPR